MIRVIDILNRTDRKKCGKDKNLNVQNGLFGMNIVRGGATHLCSGYIPAWARLTPFPCKFPESFSVEMAVAGAVAGIWAYAQNAEKTFRVCLFNQKNIAR